MFDDPQFKRAYDALSKEDKEMYKRFGEEMYSFDYEVDKDPLADYVAYINEGLKSGLHPSSLEESEVIALRSVFGPEWYKRYGYEEDPTTDIGITPKPEEKKVAKKRFPTPNWAKSKKVAKKKNDNE